MLEQQEHSIGDVSSDAQSMTQLEGIRNKVFIDRYSLKDASGKALELYPEDTWARVARGIAEVEKTEAENDLQPREDEIAEDCVAFVRATKVVPAQSPKADCVNCAAVAEATEILAFQEFRVDRMGGAFGGRGHDRSMT